MPILSPTPSKITDIIWIQTAFLGDIVLTTAALALARSHWPKLKQHLITTPIGCKALSANPELSSLIAFDKGAGKSSWQTLREVKAQLTALELNPTTTVVLQAHRSSRSSLLAACLGFPTITYRETSGSILAHTRVSRVATLHECARLALLLEPLGMPREKIVSCRPRLAVAELRQDIAWHQEIDAHPKPLVAIAPGSVWATKRWPLAAFCQLAALLASHGELGIVLVGSQAERPLTDAIAEALGEQGLSRHTPLWNLAGETSLDDLRFLFPRLSLLVANDSSPIHYASAFNVPTLAVFGATVPAMGFGPLAVGSTSLGVEGLDCRPCSDHGPQRCPLEHFRCMKELSADKVFAACALRLEQAGR